MPICPHCHKTIEVTDNVTRNMESYQAPVLSVTECCGKAVALYPRMTYTAEPYAGARKEDDWGRSIKGASVKGTYGSTCARGACSNEHAEYYNCSTQHYYCQPCARMINEVAPVLCTHTNRLLTDGEREALRAAVFNRRT